MALRTEGLSFLETDPDYSKFKGVYTRYAAYIDRHIVDVITPYQNPEVETNIYNCIYNICYILAYKQKFFPYRFEDYEDFSIFAANDLYLTFRGKHINQGQIIRGREVIPIKSSLNFIKDTLYSYKVEYQKKFFFKTYNSEWGEEEENTKRKQEEEKKRIAVENYMKSGVEEEYNYQIQEAIGQTFLYIPSILKKIIADTPYSRDKLTSNRLYKSCLLSFLNFITLPNKKLENNKLNYQQLYKLYNKENKQESIILWHLDEEMRSYVNLLVTKLKKEIAQEIGDDIHSFTLDENTIDNILETAYSTYDTDQSEDL